MRTFDLFFLKKRTTITCNGDSLDRLDCENSVISIFILEYASSVAATSFGDALVRMSDLQPDNHWHRINKNLRKINVNDAIVDKKLKSIALVQDEFFTQINFDEAYYVNDHFIVLLSGVLNREVTNHEVMVFSQSKISKLLSKCM